jgi:quinol-cytochrome oxidoreductase complex cytochrome b subunit
MGLRENLAQLPRHFADSFFRSAAFTGARRQAALVANTWFLHIHPARMHPYSLRVTFTFGLGVFAFWLFVILSATGILLMFYYIPTTDAAYATMQDLIFVVPFGRLIRNAHRWTAEGMVVVVALHLARVFFTGGYKPPREFNWLVGVGLLLLTLALSFTGYLLPWDQLAYWAITVGTSIAAYFPLFGDLLRALLLGGETVTEQTLIRFYVLHVVLLPFLLALLIGYHFWRIRKDGGLARPRALPTTENVLSYPRVLQIELAILLALLIVFLPLAYRFDAPLGAPADATHPPNPAKAPWYFVGVQELVSYSAVWGGVVAPVLLFIALLFLPYLDRDPRGVGAWFAPERKGMVAAGSVILLALVAVTIIGALLRGPNWAFYWPWEGWPGPK